MLVFNLYKTYLDHELSPRKPRILCWLIFIWEHKSQAFKKTLRFWDFTKGSTRPPTYPLFKTNTLQFMQS